MLGDSNLQIRSGSYRTYTQAQVTARNLPLTLVVSVTAEDIRWGEPCTVDGCALALAVDRRLNELGYRWFTVSVDSRSVEISLIGCDGWVRYSHNAKELVASFDRADRVEPQTVVLIREPVGVVEMVAA